MNPPPPPPDFNPTATKAKTPGIAITSLVLGILSFMCLGPLTGIPAIICGHVARGRIARSGGTLTGSGLGLAGLILGYVNIAVFVVMIPMMAAIAIPNFVKTRTTAQQNACINNLRMLDGAKQQWALENKKEPADVPTSSDLSPYLFQGVQCAAKGIYTIGSLEERPRCSVPEHVLP